MNVASFRTNPHLAVGHLQEDVDASHPAMNDSGYWKGRPRLPAFIQGMASHWSTKSSEREFAALTRSLIIYTPVTLIGASGAPNVCFCMKGRRGRPASSVLGSVDQIYATQQLG